MTVCSYERAVMCWLWESDKWDGKMHKSHRRIKGYERGKPIETQGFIPCQSQNSIWVKWLRIAFVGGGSIDIGVNPKRAQNAL